MVKTELWNRGEGQRLTTLTLSHSYLCVDMKWCPPLTLRQSSELWDCTLGGVDSLTLHSSGEEMKGPGLRVK